MVIITDLDDLPKLPMCKARLLSGMIFSNMLNGYVLGGIEYDPALDGHLVVLETRADALDHRALGLDAPLPAAAWEALTYHVEASCFVASVCPDNSRCITFIIPETLLTPGEIQQMRAGMDAAA